MPALAIWSHSQKISPGPNGSEVGCIARLFKVIWRPTSEPFGPGEIFFEWLQIARAGTFYPKFFKNHRDGQPRKFSLALMSICSHPNPTNIFSYFSIFLYSEFHQISTWIFSKRMNLSWVAIWHKFINRKKACRSFLRKGYHSMLNTLIVQWEILESRFGHSVI